MTTTLIFLFNLIICIAALYIARKVGKNEAYLELLKLYKEAIAENGKQKVLLEFYKHLILKDKKGNEHDKSNA